MTSVQMIWQDISRGYTMAKFYYQAQEQHISHSDIIFPSAFWNHLVKSLLIWKPLSLQFHQLVSDSTITQYIQTVLSLLKSCDCECLTALHWINTFDSPMSPRCWILRSNNDVSMHAWEHCKFNNFNNFSFRFKSTTVYETVSANKVHA